MDWAYFSHLVGGFNPFEKYESQLGWWHSQYKHKIHVANHQPVIPFITGVITCYNLQSDYVGTTSSATPQVLVSCCSPWVSLCGGSRCLLRPIPVVTFACRGPCSKSRTLVNPRNSPSWHPKKWENHRSLVDSVGGFKHFLFASECRE